MSRVNQQSINSSTSQNSTQTSDEEFLSVDNFNSMSQSLVTLHVLDLRSCPLRQIPAGAFSGLKDLKQAYADTYKLCCGFLFHKDFNLNDCRAPLDLISTCKDLLGPIYARIFVPLAACFNLSGNIFLFIVRIILRRWRVQSGLDMYMSHITMCDIGMGIYLVVISAVQWSNQGLYSQADISWRHSSLCQMTGLVYCTVCTVSVLLVFLASGHSVLTTRFSRAVTRRRPLTSHMVCGLAWVTGLTVAAIPLLFPHWNFYTYSAICLPVLQETSAPQNAGHDFAFGASVLIFAISLLSGLGQVSAHTLTHRQTLSSTGWAVSDDVLMIRRLKSQFSKSVLFWLLTGIITFLQWSGLVISNNFIVAMFLVLLPCNSVANCFLYFHSIYLERRRQHRALRLMAYLKAKSKRVDSGNKRTEAEH